MHFSILGALLFSAPVLALPRTHSVSAGLRSNRHLQQTTTTDNQGSGPSVTVDAYTEDPEAMEEIEQAIENLSLGDDWFGSWSGSVCYQLQKTLTNVNTLTSFKPTKLKKIEFPYWLLHRFKRYILSNSIRQTGNIVRISTGRFIMLVARDTFTSYTSSLLSLI